MTVHGDNIELNPDATATAEAAPPISSAARDASPASGVRRTPTVNMLTKWSMANASTPRLLRVVWPSENGSMFIPFTTEATPVNLHRLDVHGRKESVHCSDHGDGCLLCRLSFTLDTRDLLPVYDMLAMQVVLLSIAQSVRPGALGPQILPILERIAQGEKLILLLKRIGWEEYEVQAHPLKPGVSNGAAAIRQFTSDYTNERIHPSDAFKIMTLQDLLSIQEVRMKADVTGITS